MKNRLKIISLINEMLSHYCCEELAKAANALLDSLDNKNEHDNAIKFVEVLKDSIETFDELKEFSKTDHCKEVFGDGYDAFIKHVSELEEQHAEYCDCPSCSLALQLLELKEDILSD